MRDSIQGVGKRTLFSRFSRQKTSAGNGINNLQNLASSLANLWG